MSWAEVKHALNSTLGTDEFEPLDQLLSHGVVIIKESTVWNIPKGIKRIYVTACGGGGGGGNSPTTYNTHYPGSGGSGAACIVHKVFSVEGIDSLSITVGKGGRGGVYALPAEGGTIAQNGEATIIGDLVTLPGGNAGTDQYTPKKHVNGVYPGGGYGGSALGTRNSSDNPFLHSDRLGGKGVCINGITVGDYESTTYDYELNKSYTYTGYGGSSLGLGGTGGSYYGHYGSNENATDGGYGAGGGGGCSGSVDAGNGGDGIVIIEW